MAPFKVGNNHGAVCATPLKTTLQHQHDEDMVKTVKKSKKKAKHPEVVAQQIIKRPAPYSEPELCTTDDDFQDRLPVVANPATPRKKTRITVADVHDICHAQTIHLTGMIGRLEDKLDQLLESNFAPAGGTTAPVDSSAVKAAPKEKKEKLPPVSYALFTKHARPSAVKLIEDSGHKASMGCISKVIAKVWATVSKEDKDKWKVGEVRPIPDAVFDVAWLGDKAELLSAEESAKVNGAKLFEEAFDEVSKASGKDTDSKGTKEESDAEAPVEGSEVQAEGPKSTGDSASDSSE